MFTGNRKSLNHEKKMEYFSFKDDITPVKIQTRQTNSDGTVEMAENMSEIVVPTCSYRMGVQVAIYIQYTVDGDSGVELGGILV